MQFIETEAENKDKEDYMNMIKENLSVLAEKGTIPSELHMFVTKANAGNFMLEELIVKTFEKADDKANKAI